MVGHIHQFYCLRQTLPEVVFRFSCHECDLEKEENKVVTKFVEGFGICVAVFCDECEGLMDLTNPKKGLPKHRDTTSW